MPVPQQLPGQRSPCSGCQTLSPPSSACPPSGRGLLFRREAALLGEVFLSERTVMPPSPGCPSISLLCCSFCGLSPCLSRPPYEQCSALRIGHLLTQSLTLQYLVAHPVGITSADRILLVPAFQAGSYLAAGPLDRATRHPSQVASGALSLVLEA